MNLTRGINLARVAEMMNGCSGADLKAVCTEGLFARSLGFCGWVGGWVGSYPPLLMRSGSVWSCSPTIL